MEVVVQEEVKVGVSVGGRSIKRGNSRKGESCKNEVVTEK